MKTKSLLTAIAIVVLSSSVGYAQRVESTLDDGHPVINCEGMPASAYTTTPKGNTEELLKTGDANKTVYKRFAVCNTDNGVSFYWKSAFTVCNNDSGGGWRLPTQRELIMMWVLKRELEKTSGFVQFNILDDAYRCATESGDDACYIVSFTVGGVSTISKQDVDLPYPARVRCIRELPMP